MTEDEIIGWHHQLDRHESEQLSGVGDRQGSMTCCSPWGCKELDTTEWLDWRKQSMMEIQFFSVKVVMKQRGLNYHFKKSSDQKMWKILEIRFLQWTKYHIWKKLQWRLQKISSPPTVRLLLHNLPNANAGTGNVTLLSNGTLVAVPQAETEKNLHVTVSLFLILLGPRCHVMKPRRNFWRQWPSP